MSNVILYKQKYNEIRKFSYLIIQKVNEASILFLIFLSTPLSIKVYKAYPLDYK